MTRKFRASLAQLERAERSIPLGSQTFSKSRVALPLGAAPLFVTHGKGGHVWDVDGNEYVDLVCGLGCVTLGYCDPFVDAAVREQLDVGMTFSLPHPLEAIVAETLIEVIPCAERVRFGKNGSDATSAAIRLARAHTGREHILMCGYHGWHDWSIGTTSRNAGVPGAVRALTQTFAYGDLEDVARQLDVTPVAAVMLEVMNVVEPPAGFLEGLRELCTEHGTLLIFDETVTGFRHALGGAQACFGVTPDIATFGKGLGNGLPVSAVCGRADIMSRFEEIFFSTTFGGETLALAAADAVLMRLRTEPVLETIASRGSALAAGLNSRIEKYGAHGLLSASGHPSVIFVNLKPKDPASLWNLRTLFLQEMCENGVLTLGTHNMCYAHTDEDVAKVLAAYDNVLPQLVEAEANGDAAKRLRGEPLVPLFRVR
jgi:glutamate-1-semialdehyde 2,1-aminomutase